MVTVFVFKDGTAREVPALDPLWLAPGATEVFWVDLETPNEEERKLLTDTFHFHELAVEDAIQETHHPKIEQYGGMLYLILHGIAAGKKHQGFETRDVELPVGSLLVPTSQRLGGLVFYLLEPECDDGLTTWNFLDSGLKVGASHPVLKSIP